MSFAFFNRLKKFIFFSDLLFLNLAIIIAHFILFGGRYPNLSSKTFIFLANASWIMISSINGSYKIFQPFDINAIVDKCLMTLLYLSLWVFGIIYFFKISNISRGLVMITLLVFFIALVAQRMWLVYFFGTSRRDHLNRKVVILGNKLIADSVISVFSRHPELGYQDYKFLEGNEFLTDMSNWEQLLAEKPPEIFVCYKEMNIALIDKLIQFGEKNSIKISVVFDSILNDKKRQLNFDELPILHFNSQPETALRIKVFKRSFDILFAVMLMVIGAPLFVLLYLITRMSSRGKVFYKQERIGKNEKPFFIYKFRSMYSDAEKSGPQLSSDNDPRITKWGNIMRKTRLDELPQFWNVLKGEMSIVGYRPERKHFIEEICKKIPEYKSMLDHKPGITSLGQVHYGYAQNVDQMCERLNYDLLYFRNVNLDSDINIILKTVKVMVKAKGK